jgi:hypothetical protein
VSVCGWMAEHERPVLQIPWNTKREHQIARFFAVVANDEFLYKLFALVVALRSLGVDKGEGQREKALIQPL